ncbi:MAG TPA: hypothetical protein VFX70_07985 [Mycobacteriales bacterium]|nr:hypothetical protein [Mycobacteriales bacterium]
MIGLAGCSGSGPDPGGGTATGARDLPTAESQVVAVDLTVTGVVHGHVTSAKTGSKFACGTPGFPDLFTLNDLEITLGGNVWAFGISATAYSGPGRITGQLVVTLADPKSPATGYLSKGTGPARGNVVVNPDKQSGTVTADLYRNLGDDKPTMHVTGTWRCP